MLRNSCLVLRPPDRGSDRDARINRPRMLYGDAGLYRERVRGTSAHVLLVGTGAQSHLNRAGRRVAVLSSGGIDGFVEGPLSRNVKGLWNRSRARSRPVGAGQCLICYELPLLESYCLLL
jgi:hypothetical protein